MATVKISGLPAASAVVDANEFEINEAGTSKKVTGSQIASHTIAKLDGDKGDITVSSSGASWTIDNDAVTTDKLNNSSVTSDKINDQAVTFAKIQNVDTEKLVGRSTAGSGSVEEISVGSGLSLTGGTLSATSAGGGDYVMTTFTSPGTWSKPAGLKAVKVTVVGGGGAGGGVSASTVTPTSMGGGGGGGGGAAIRYIPAPTIPGPVSVTRGAAGGTSSFGSFASATGGANGGAVPSGNNGGAGGNGGIGSSGDLNIGGGDGGAGYSTGANTGAAVSGTGGSSILGGGGKGVFKNTPSGAVNGEAGNVYGGGGSGAAKYAAPGSGSGGAGAAGVVIVEEFY